MTYVSKEREQLVRDIAEREALKRGEMLAWCEARNDPQRNRTPDAEPVVTRSTPATRRENQAMAHNMTAEWQSYIAREADLAAKGWTEAVVSAVGVKLKEMRDEQATLDKHLVKLVQQAELRSEQAEVAVNRLSLELAELKGRLDGRDEAEIRRLKSVRPAALIA
jgi:hypothetical protein